MQLNEMANSASIAEEKKEMLIASFKWDLARNEMVDGGDGGIHANTFKIKCNDNSCYRRAHHRSHTMPGKMQNF